MMLHFPIALLALGLTLLTSFHTASADDTIVVGFKEGKEPYVLASSPFKDSDYDMSNNLGIELDVFKEVFAMYGKTVRPIYMNYERMTKQITSGQLDAAGNVQNNLDGIHYYDKYIHMHDHIIFSSKFNDKIKHLSDLEGKRVVAFQHAGRFLGADFKNMIPKFASYNEMVKQEKQVLLLASGRTDVIIIDIGIFKYWAKRHAQKGTTFNSVPLFKDPYFYAAGFKTKELRDQFAQGIAKLRISGRYDEIYKKYMD